MLSCQKRLWVYELQTEHRLQMASTLKNTLLHLLEGREIMKPNWSKLYPKMCKKDQKSQETRRNQETKQSSLQNVWCFGTFIKHWQPAELGVFDEGDVRVRRKAWHKRMVLKLGILAPLVPTKMLETLKRSCWHYWNRPNIENFKLWPCVIKKSSKACKCLCKKCVYQIIWGMTVWQPTSSHPDFAWCPCCCTPTPTWWIKGFLLLR